MDVGRFRNSPTGSLREIGIGQWAFVPNPLPPPGLDTFSTELVAMMSEADRGLGALQSLAGLVPNPRLLVAPYVRKEAVLSSRIEGTQASLSDIFYHEASKGQAGTGDILEVLNYVQAMNYGLSRLRKIPLGLDLVKGIHSTLMKGVRGEAMNPGQFRTRQNWIGPAGCSLVDATYVPPPAGELEQALRQWEEFLHRDDSLVPLVKCALMHYQFEAIHPFLDGNGRVGRLLITLYLCEKGHLDHPVLYLSDYFERHRDEYYRLLLGVSKEGSWDLWLRYFVRGVAEQSKIALQTSHRILALQKEFRRRLEAESVPPSAFKLMDILFLNPFVSLPGVSDQLKITWPTAKASVERLVKLGILTEVSGRRRNRIYCARELLTLLAG